MASEGGALRGQSLVKLFAHVVQDEHGNEQIISQRWFTGLVEEYSEASGLYRIVYEDGDTEELTASAL